MRNFAFFLLLVVFGPLGCGPIADVDRGHELFSEPKLSVSPSNVFSCSTCHAATLAGMDARRLPGYTLLGAPRRPNFWGGEVSLLLDATNVCLVEFMRGEPLAPDDPSGLALLAYLRSLSSAADPALPLSIVRNIDSTYLARLTSGDTQRGEGLYRSACAYCHGDVGNGKGRLGSRVSILPNATVDIFGDKTHDIMIEKIRHGKFFGIGGNMPLYSTETLSDGEVADIVAYLLKR